MKKTAVITAIMALMAALGLTGYKIVKDTGGPVGANVDSGLVEVGKVIDGDTFVLEDGTKVRLIGIDAPEEAECYFEESSSYLKWIIAGKNIKLEKDISGADEYGRLLRYAIVPSSDAAEDNLLVNEALVRDGFARRKQSPPDNRYRDLLAAAEAEAKKNERGLWKECAAILDVSSGANEEREIDTPPPSPECVIKGNISEKGYGKTYLVPGCDNYEKTKIDTRKGEQYFCSESDAVAGGFRKAENCP
ncbi:MAG: Micrococcal nuclease-like protein nuclease [Candidatus Jorgensenbacteria bacterium GW2011_GWA2_45_9]|uniref:Micrococcal nuclease-like protein nuclease n=1 Tax=Candidatus Jorgensenbacteria bacterium GW2011_GWA2_45_9 TaxID=1618663 RepID=A0A0G1QAG2_9BACT|nr:MAG: Micrococcal nuclease-like protein nuclease [Candidatus Jorgensenbacteria bacterium GW2011_GWA2_45_9]